jgi:DNA-directed RNA polymerase subunit RPC12/RpoP
MSSFPCFLCGKPLVKRVDKNGKFYLVCDDCGSQFFVRKKSGMVRLEELIRASEQNAIPMAHATERLFKVQALLAEIEGTKSQIEALEAQIGLFFPDEDKIKTRNALKTRLDKLLEQFEDFCANTRA